MGGLQVGAGILAGELLINKMLAGQSPNMRALGKGVGAVALAMFAPGLLPAAMGLAGSAMLDVGRPLLKLPAPSLGIRGLSAGDQRLLEQVAGMADGGMVNGGNDAGFVNGISDNGERSQYDYETDGDRASV